MVYESFDPSFLGPSLSMKFNIALDRPPETAKRFLYVVKYTDLHYARLLVPLRCWPEIFLFIPWA